MLARHHGIVYLDSAFGCKTGGGCHPPPVFTCFPPKYFDPLENPHETRQLIPIMGYRVLRPSELHGLAVTLVTSIRNPLPSG